MLLASVQPQPEDCGWIHLVDRTQVFDMAKKLPVQQAQKRISVSPWDLPAPTIEYHSDVCSYQDLHGTPTLYWGQLGFSGRIISVVAISFPRERFEGWFRSLDALKERTDKIELSDKDLESMTIKDFASTADNFKKFSAHICRAGSTDDFAFMDFYGVPLFIEGVGYNSKHIEPSPLLRVSMSAALLKRFMLFVESYQQEATP